MTRKERLAEFVKQKVEESGLSQREIAKRSEAIKDHTVISNIISKKGRLPSIEMFVALAEALNADPFEMLEAYLGRPYIEDQDKTVRAALKWARLVKRQGDPIWLKKLQQDIELLNRLIAEGRVADPGSEPNGGEDNDKPEKPTASGGGKPDLIHSQLRGRIAV